MKIPLEAIETPLPPHVNPECEYINPSPHLLLSPLYSLVKSLMLFYEHDRWSVYRIFCSCCISDPGFHINYFYTRTILSVSDNKVEIKTNLSLSEKNHRLDDMRYTEIIWSNDWMFVLLDCFTLASLFNPRGHCLFTCDIYQLFPLKYNNYTLNILAYSKESCLILIPQHKMRLQTANNS